MKPGRAALAFAAIVGAGGPAAAGAPVEIDRVAVRFDSSETGSIASPRFVFARELAFEARLESLADPERSIGSPFGERHVRKAVERHVAESLLASLPMDPPPTAPELDRRRAIARASLEQRVGGREALASAADAEGVADDEVGALVDREARASLYLDRMVAPMLEPSDAELRERFRVGAPACRGREFDACVGDLRRAEVSDRLSSALAVFFQNARSRVHVTIVGP